MCTLAVVQEGIVIKVTSALEQLLRSYLTEKA
jgi:hypothetical protein